LQAELESATRSKIFLTLSIMAVAAGLGLAFAASILRQVKALSNATAELAAGNAYARVPAQGNDELGKLGISFNAMAEKIQRQADDLRRSHDGLRNHAEELEVANKDLEAFAFSVSHDLRAPLRVVGGFSRQLSSSFAGQIDDKAQHFLERIRAGVVMMEQLVEGLLRLSRLGRQALDSHPVDVAAIVHDVLAQLRSEQVLTNAEVEVSSYLPPAVGDHVLLRQVFTNLLSNACKFTAARVLPTINIGYELRDGENIYYVRDNGAGFDLAVASRLFEPFQRLHHDKDFVGLGIGLSIVKRIVQRHGGRIWFDAAEGKGACFYFTLGGVPAAESASP
jgi:signal transduction histidine kinase